MDMIWTRGKGIGRLLLALALLVGLISQPVRPALAATASAATCAAPTGVTTGGYPQAVLADNPLGYWRLDETCGGTVYDSSGNGLSGQINGGVTTGQSGAPVGDGDPAMGFDGSTGSISLGDPAALQPAQVSVEAWINTTVAGGIIVRKRLFGYALALNGSGQPTFTITDAHTAVYDATGSTAVTDGRWHHLVGT